MNTMNFINNISAAVTNSSTTYRGRKNAKRMWRDN